MNVESTPHSQQTPTIISQDSQPNEIQFTLSELDEIEEATQIPPITAPLNLNTKSSLVKTQKNESKSLSSMYMNNNDEEKEYQNILAQIEKLSSRLKTLPTNNPYYQQAIDHKLSSKQWTLTWRNITNAIDKELYLQIAIKMSQIIQVNDIKDKAINYTSKQEQNDEKKKGIEFILNDLKLKMDVDIDEIEFIRDIIKRAKAFQLQMPKSCMLIEYIISTFSNELIIFV